MLIMLYSHDSYGLGHIRRTLEIASQLVDDIPDASLIILTGSMQAHTYALPPRTEYIKLPTLTKNKEGRYCSRSLPHPIDITLELRQRIILESLCMLKPDIFLVDKSPAGIKGELLPALRHCKAFLPHTKLVLGMRDIEDDPSHVAKEWAHSGIVPLLEHTYDAIFLYGTRALYDPVQEYGLSPQIEQKLVSCGYIGRNQSPPEVEHIKRELGLRTNRFVLVSPGGGDDGYSIVETYVRMLREHTRPGRHQFDSLIVTGPLMCPEKRQALKQAAREDLALKVIDFTPHLYDYLRAADLVVSMGGYNTVVEILTANQRGIIVPRVHPRLEQCIRAERLAATGLLDMIHPTKLTPSHLFRAVTQSIQQPRPPRSQDVGVPLNGAANVSKAMTQLFLQGQRDQTSAPHLLHVPGVHLAPAVLTTGLPA
ncbi:MAG: glycosyltransferase family protein [Nitrospira sp.]